MLWQQVSTVYRHRHTDTDARRADVDGDFDFVDALVDFFHPLRSIFGVQSLV